ncbi:MAG: hypothetical protein GXP46_12350 [Deferribacteres bacterium]|nr:hypothetical protein [Deferribacteres bacterium]
MALLGVLLISFGLILGVFTTSRALKKLGRVLAGVSLLPVFMGIAESRVFGLSYEQKLMLVTAVAAVCFIAVLRILLGKNFFRRAIGRVVYDGGKTLFLLPFKMIGKLLQTYK